MTHLLPAPRSILPLLAGLGLWLSLGLPARAADPLPGISTFQLDSFAANCLQLLERGRFVQAAALFHLDPELSAELRGQERDALAATLAGVRSELGDPQRAARLAAPQQAHQFVLQSMTGDYWAAYSRFYPASYRVAYSRGGEGYLTLAIVVYDHRLQLRAIAFGLPVERPGSEARIGALVRSLRSVTPAGSQPRKE